MLISGKQKSKQVDYELMGGALINDDDDKDPFDFDDREMLLCFACYEKTWDKPKACICLPYEAILRFFSIFLISQFLGSLFLLFLKRKETYNFELFTEDYQLYMYVGCLVIIVLIEAAYTKFFVWYWFEPDTEDNRRGLLIGFKIYIIHMIF